MNSVTTYSGDLLQGVTGEFVELTDYLDLDERYCELSDTLDDLRTEHERVLSLIRQVYRSI